MNGGIHAENAPSRIRGHFARHLAKRTNQIHAIAMCCFLLLLAAFAKRRSVENDSLCKLVYVKMNMHMHMLPCSLLPIVGNKSSDHVQHEKPESWDDMLSFRAHFDTAHEIEMEFAQQLAGVGEKISDSIGHEETEIVDVDSHGDW
jgi:hypothetical protein